MKTMTIPEFQAALRGQGISAREHYALRCPMCGTVQSAADLISAGAGRSFDEVEKFLGFACVGRWTGAPAPRKKHDGRPCNWSLGGLFTLHKLEVIDEAGLSHPRFEPATPVEAQILEAARTLPAEMEDARG